MNMHFTADCRFVVASGGDDNEVVVSSFEITEDESISIQIIRKYEPKILHSAQITGKSSICPIAFQGNSSY